MSKVSAIRSGCQGVGWTPYMEVWQPATNELRPFKKKSAEKCLHKIAFLYSIFFTIDLSRFFSVHFSPFVIIIIRFFRSIVTPATVSTYCDAILLTSFFSSFVNGRRIIVRYFFCINLLIVTISIKKKENCFGLRHVQRIKSIANTIFKLSSIRIDKLFILPQGDHVALSRFVEKTY